LRERAFGHFEGQTFQDIEATWPEDAARWRQRDPDFGPGGGERLLDFYERCVRAATQLAQRTRARPSRWWPMGACWIACTAPRWVWSLQAPRSWPVANAAINRLLWTPQGLSMVSWHDAAHLEGVPATNRRRPTRPESAPSGHLRGREWLTKARAPAMTGLSLPAAPSTPAGCHRGSAGDGFATRLIDREFRTGGVLGLLACRCGHDVEGALLRLAGRKGKGVPASQVGTALHRRQGRGHAIVLVIAQVGGVDPFHEGLQVRQAAGRRGAMVRIT
jgi:hypothetical protein